MEKLTPFLILLLLPIEMLGSILTILYQTVKHMNSFKDIDGAKKGFLYGVELDREFWLFVKHILLSLIPKRK